MQYKQNLAAVDSIVRGEMVRGFGFLSTVTAILDESSELVAFPRERSDAGEEEWTSILDGAPCNLSHQTPCSSRCSTTSPVFPLMVASRMSFGAQVPHIVYSDNAQSVTCGGE